MRWSYYSMVLGLALATGGCTAAATTEPPSANLGEAPPPLREMRTAPPFPVNSETRLCVTLQVHRDVYQPDNPNEWMNFDAAFAARLGELSRTGDYHALSEQSEQLLFPGDASSCSRFPGFVAIAARYYREPGARLPVFEYTMEGHGSVHLQRITRRYVDEDIVDPAHFHDIGNPLGWAFYRVLERRSTAILNEITGKGE